MNNITHTQVAVKLLSRNILTNLIREELKSRKLASIRHSLGVEEQCSWLPTVNDPIADCLGIKTDPGFQEYDMLMEGLALQAKTVEDCVQLANDLTETLMREGS